MPARRDPDEGPSEADVDRFGEDSPVADANCPDCGAAVWSEADVCSKCFAYLGGETAPRQKGLFHRHWKALIVWALIIATLTVAGIPLLQSLVHR